MGVRTTRACLLAALTAACTGLAGCAGTPPQPEPVVQVTPAAQGAIPASAADQTGLFFEGLAEVDPDALAQAQADIDQLFYDWETHPEGSETLYVVYVPTAVERGYWTEWPDTVSDVMGGYRVVSLSADGTVLGTYETE